MQSIPVSNGISGDAGVGGGLRHTVVGEQPRGLCCVWSSPHLVQRAPMRTAARVQSGLCWCGCDAGYCATIVGRRGDGGSAGMVGMALAAVGGAMHKAGTVCTFFCGDHGGGGADGIFELLAGNTAAMAGTACFSFGGDHGGEGADGKYVLAGMVAEARTAFSSFGGEHGGDGGDARRRREHGGGGADGNFLAGSTATETRTACIFFWRGPRRRRQGRHIFLLAGSTAAKAGTASFVFWQRHGGGYTASTTGSTSGQTSAPPL